MLKHKCKHKYNKVYFFPVVLMLVQGNFGISNKWFLDKNGLEIKADVSKVKLKAHQKH